MLSYPTREAEMYFRDWRAISAEYVLIGQVTLGTQIRIDFQLFDTTRQMAIDSGTVMGPGNRTAHAVASRL
jgi:TolB protein